MKFLFLIVSALFLITSCTKTVNPPEPVLPVPSERQLDWHELEQYAFIHFTTNTFTNKEWGFGDENPDIFNPSALNTDQWAHTIKEAGLKGIILTCKHHDGFCLWPSEFTEHSVKNTKWMDGKGDVVKDVRESCEKYGLKFGVYLSPWDRNRSDYAQPSYIEYYRNQLSELFNNYGPVFEMWFDGANGGDGYYGGANEKRTIDGANYYDWPTTINMIRGMEPDIVFFSDAGPDVRWCGNEKGYVGETNWSLLSTDTIYAGKPHINELLNHGHEDGIQWIPAEVDVSIRPGWFYHLTEDSLVKTPEQLFDIYLNSVGRGANLILNIPPDQRGVLHENDVKSLQGWKKLIDEAFSANLALGSRVKVSNFRGKSEKYGAANLIDGQKDTYWATDDKVTEGSIEIELEEKKQVNYLLIQEYIRLGQRIKKFSLDVWQNDGWKNVSETTTIGYKRIIKIEPVITNKIRINIIDSKACPLISNIEVY